MKKTSVGLVVILVLASGLLGNGLIPSFSYDSVTAGFGYTKGRFAVDFGLEYLIGQKRRVLDGVMPGVYEMKIWVPMLSLSYGF